MHASNRAGLALLLALAALPAAHAQQSAVAVYDGTHCRAPGNCWQPQPGYPEKKAGSKYDTRYDPTELAKQQQAEDAMVARNRKRVENYKKTGHFVYDVDQIK